MQKVRAFFAAFRGEWFAVMSGAFSVPFAALGAFVEGEAKAIFIALAFLGSWYAAFRIFSSEHAKAQGLEVKILELESHLKPKLVCSFGINDGCYRPNTPLRDRQTPSGPSLGSWYRIRVENKSSVPITKCSGRLVSIKRGDTELLMGEMPLLPFSPQDAIDALSKTIYPNVAEYLDLLAIRESDVLLVLRGFLSAAVQWHDLFSLPGDYTLSVVVVSDGVTSEPINILFRWTLNQTTASLQQK